jgi:hypothetical protein
MGDFPTEWEWPASATSRPNGDMLRIVMSSIMRCRGGVICLLIGELLSIGLHESALDIQIAETLGLKPIGQNTKQEMARQVRGRSPPKYAKLQQTYASERIPLPVKRPPTSIASCRLINAADLPQEHNCTIICNVTIA